MNGRGTLEEGEGREKAKRGEKGEAADPCERFNVSDASVLTMAFLHLSVFYLLTFL